MSFFFWNIDNDLWLQDAKTYLLLNKTLCLLEKVLVKERTFCKI